MTSMTSMLMNKTQLQICWWRSWRFCCFLQCWGSHGVVVTIIITSSSFSPSSSSSSSSHYIAVWAHNLVIFDNKFPRFQLKNGFQRKSVHFLCKIPTPSPLALCVNFHPKSFLQSNVINVYGQECLPNVLSPDECSMHHRIVFGTDRLKPMWLSTYLASFSSPCCR